MAGENTYLRETGEGATVFQSNGWYFQNTASPAVTGVHFTDAGAATFASTITSGQIFSTGGTVSGVLTFGAGNELRFGTSNEFGLFYSSGTSNIRVNSGILAIRADDLRLTNQANDEYYLKGVAYGS